MRKKESPADDSTGAGKSLRKRAEEIVRARLTWAKPPSDVNQLIHELRVHQVELETQNG